MAEGWRSSLVIPLYKKRDCKDPQNYWPISLIDIATKIYAKSILQKLEEWADKNLEEQAGFRQGRSIEDNCCTLLHLILKYSSRGKQLYRSKLGL